MLFSQVIRCKRGRDQFMIVKRKRLIDLAVQDPPEQEASSVRSRRWFVLAEQFADESRQGDDADDDKFLRPEEQDPESFEQAELGRHSARH
jgi:hypothetical protein